MHQHKASISFSATRMLMVAPHLPNVTHQHNVIQITFSLEGHPFDVWTPGDEWRQAGAVIINAEVPHAAKNFKGWQVTCCIYPGEAQGKALQEKILKGADIQYLDRDIFTNQFAPLLQVREHPVKDTTDFVQLTNRIYDCLIGEPGFKPPLEERIKNTLHYIQNNIQQSLPAALLAQNACLSQDRFLHLFKEQVGVPLRQYILLQRMAFSFKLFMQGRSLKEAAFEAGFSDAAHFTRTFVQIMGIKPSTYAEYKSHFNFNFFLY